MTTTRPTKEFKTSGGHTFVFYEYITGRDKRAIESVFYNNADIKPTKMGSDIEMSGFSGSIHEMQDKAWELIILSASRKESADLIQGVQGIKDFILDLPEAEYNEVVAEINSITDPKKAPATS